MEREQEREQEERQYEAQMNEPKPCPYCGVTPEAKRSSDEIVTVCLNPVCPIYAHHFELRAWNTRPVEDALRAALREIRDMPEKTEPAYGLDEADQATNDGFKSGYNFALDEVREIAARGLDEEA